ncbi:MAG TPA: hypothetical protein VKA46_36160 [Gemmataceae bacterium]|nr:hypothetical protein [Gemmataceae bacterium]
MLQYTIDDPITQPLTYCVEVTITFGDGRKRWCFFATPEALTACGDWVEGTRVRVHLGVPHRIVVSELSAEIIDRVLKGLHATGELEAHTLPLSGEGA